MTHFFRVISFALFLVWAQSLAAQTWIQVEARPNQAEALARAGDYAARVADVNGFRLASGWYAIALGPYSDDKARRLLLQLLAARAVPSDSFLADGSSFAGSFFGPGDAAAALAAPAPAEPLPPVQPGDETPAEARASERLLDREARALVQTALRWEGVYASVIDADFGPGTRRAMALWQEARGYEPTGILTTRQRQELVGGYLDVLRALDMRETTDARAGIRVALPAGMVRFERIEPPFAHYAPAGDFGVRVILISQTGDADTLGALYDILQTLEIVPLDGPRELRRDSFSIDGGNERIVSHSFARLAEGTVKGFVLVWPAGDDRRFRLALDAMQASFAPLDGVLPDTAAGAQDIDLLAGLEIRRADRARSGFYVDSAGGVLTTTEAVRQCARITLDDEAEADIAAEDGALGLALLRPRQTLAPVSVARLAAAEPRLQSDVAVAGYSYGGALTAPSVTFGRLADVKGLDGDTRIQRLEIGNEPGDAGGPVFDGSGAVLGMLLEPDSGARLLPAGVAFAADAPALAEFLSANGVSAAAADPDAAMAPEDLALLAADLTVLVSCWN